MSRRTGSPLLQAISILGLAALVIALAFPPAARALDYSYARVVRLSLVEGDVQVFRPGAEDWEAAELNLPIQ